MDALLRGLLLLMLGIAVGQGAESRILFVEDFAKPLGDRWKPVRFHDPTEYRIINENSNACLKASAWGDCSALATKVDLEPHAGITVTWKWKIDTCPTNAADDRLAAFNHSARVFVAFDTLIGPPRTINYVWANRSRTNSTFDHPLSSRAKFIVIQTGNRNAGQWFAERRNLAEDWKRLFDGAPMPRIVGVGVLTDSHRTRVPVNAWYDDIVLERK